jgi:hypothetical protein
MLSGEIMYVVIVNAAVAILILAAVNWRYRSVLASKDAQIELLVRQVGEWKQKAEGAAGAPGIGTEITSEMIADGVAALSEYVIWDAPKGEVVQAIFRAMRR